MLTLIIMIMATNYAEGNNDDAIENDENDNTGGNNGNNDYNDDTGNDGVGGLWEPGG